MNLMNQLYFMMNGMMQEDEPVDLTQFNEAVELIQAIDDKLDGKQCAIYDIETKDIICDIVCNSMVNGLEFYDAETKDVEAYCSPEQAYMLMFNAAKRRQIII